MFLLLSRNNPYLEELNGNPNNQMAHKDLEGLEIDLKNRFKDQDKNMNNYKLQHLDDSLESHSDLISDDGDSVDSSASNKTSLNSFMSDKSKINTKENTGVVNKEIQIKLNKITRIKVLIKISEILGMIFVIFTHIISQIEDDNFYDVNKELRIAGSLLINNVYENGTNATFENTFDDSKMNLRKSFSYCLENDIKEKHTNYPKIFDEYIKNYNLTNNFHNLTNLQILNALNINNMTYHFTFNTENSNKISFSLDIDNKSNCLRIIILVFSCIGFIFYFLSWYFQFYIEEIIKNEIILLSKGAGTETDETRSNNIITSNINHKTKPFYKTSYFLYTLLDLIFLGILPYPYDKTTFRFRQLGTVAIYPTSSLCNAILSFRIFYLFKLLNVFSLYTKPDIEKILIKHSIQPNFIFNVKAYQKKYPFIFLSVLFIITIYVFGLCIRYFEIYYWEGHPLVDQHWQYRWNAFWCLFISMTTVAFGDFYPKSHFGKVLIIIAIIIGIYFISMMMRYITFKSILTDTEQKAYKLITRLRHRAELKNVNANIIYHSLKMIQLKKKSKKKKLEQRQIDMEFNSEKKEILEQIEEYKIYNEKLKTCDKVQTKDQLIEILEQIEKNIYDIQTELEILEKMNMSFSGYKNTQLLMIKFLKKSILNTQFIYEILQRKPKIFGVLGLEAMNVEKEKTKLRQQIDNLYKNYQEAGSNDNPENKNAENENIGKSNERPSIFPQSNKTAKAKNNNKYAISNANDKNNQGIKKDQFNWENFFASNINNHRKKNKRYSNASELNKFKKSTSLNNSISSTLVGAGRKLITEDLYSKELEKYNVTQEEFKQHFYSTFFEEVENNNNSNRNKNMNNNKNKNVIMRNSPKTLSSIAVMKNIKKRIDAILQQRNRYCPEEDSEDKHSETENDK